MRSRRLLVAVLLLSICLSGCKNSESTSGGTASAFAVEVSGSQHTDWTDHSSCGGVTDDGNGSQDATIATDGPPPVVALRDDAGTSPITGDYLLPLRIELSRSAHETSTGTGGCGPDCSETNTCDTQPDCGDRSVPLQVTLHYNDGVVSLLPASGDGWMDAYAACPLIGPDTLLGADEGSGVQVSAGLTAADLLDSDSPALSVLFTATTPPDTGSHGLTSQSRLRMKVQLQRRSKYAIGKKYKFESCADARSAIVGEQIASDAWELAFQPGKVTYTKAPDGGWTAKTTLKASRKNPDTITLPDWTNASGANLAAWNKMKAALATHERGHSEITDKFVQEHQADDVAGHGATQEAARQDLQQQVSDHVQQAGQQLADKQNAYDAKTEHGVKQSTVGGDNVILECPGTVPTS